MSRLYLTRQMLPLLTCYTSHSTWQTRNQHQHQHQHTHSWHLSGQCGGTFKSRRSNHSRPSQLAWLHYISHSLSHPLLRGCLGSEGGKLSLVLFVFFKCFYQALLYFGWCKSPMLAQTNKRWNGQLVLLSRSACFYYGRDKLLQL